MAAGPLPAGYSLSRLYGEAAQRLTVQGQAVLNLTVFCCTPAGLPPQRAALTPGNDS